MHAVEVTSIFPAVCPGGIARTKGVNTKGAEVILEGLPLGELENADERLRRGERLFLVFTDNDSKMLMTEDAMKRRGMEIPVSIFPRYKT